MRDYLSPAKRYVSRVIPHPGALGTFVAKRKSLSFAIAASFVLITTLGFVTVKGLMQDSTVNQSAVNKDDDSAIESAISDANLSESTTPPVESTEQASDSTSQSSSSSTNNSSTSVTVNNQPIDVPANGSVHKVVQTDNGTTKVDISVSSNSSGSTNSSSNTSTNFNMNTNTFSRSSESHSQ